MLGRTRDDESGPWHRLHAFSHAPAALRIFRFAADSAPRVLEITHVSKFLRECAVEFGSADATLPGALRCDFASGRFFKLREIVERNAARCPWLAEKLLALGRGAPIPAAALAPDVTRLDVNWGAEDARRDNSLRLTHGGFGLKCDSYVYMLPWQVRLVVGLPIVGFIGIFTLLGLVAHLHHHACWAGYLECPQYETPHGREIVTKDLERVIMEYLVCCIACSLPFLGLLGLDVLLQVCFGCRGSRCARGPVGVSAGKHYFQVYVAAKPVHPPGPDHHFWVGWAPGDVSVATLNGSLHGVRWVNSNFRVGNRPCVVGCLLDLDATPPRVTVFRDGEPVLVRPSSDLTKDGRAWFPSVAMWWEPDPDQGPLWHISALHSCTT
jgi:hypothetical protein